MDAATPRAHSTLLTAMPRKRGPPPPLRITTPAQNPDSPPVSSETSASASTLSSATSDADSFIFPPPIPKPRLLRNMKKLSLTLPSAQSSTYSLGQPNDSGNAQSSVISATADKRRLSIVSLPNPSIASLLTRKGEDVDEPQAAAYANGPVQILPGIWLGSEDNARDWTGLIERGIRSILNVAKEVASVLDVNPAPLRPTMSVPDLTDASEDSNPTYFPAHPASGRPALYYLKLPWSHGQSDLVQEGFPVAMVFVDKAIARGDGVLIHCQCGVSRSATLAIALVMRAAASRSPHVPSEVWALKGMQAAYDFTKAKSQWIGPNMSLIYQLLDYERSLKSEDASTELSDQSGTEEEWGRRRSRLDEVDVDTDRESMEVVNEAKALDQAMVDRIVARKSSASSMDSMNSNRGIKTMRKPRYPSRKRTPSVCSVTTLGSVLSENLVEEDEEEGLLGVGGGFDASSVEACYSAGSSEPTEDEASSASRSEHGSTLPSRPASAMSAVGPRAPLKMPASAGVHKTVFKLPPMPATAVRSSFDDVPRVPTKPKSRRRPPPLGLLPTVPPSPITPVNEPEFPVVEQSIPIRSRRESRRPETPPSHIRSPPKAQPRPRPLSFILPSPKETLLVFPPSPTFTTRVPSTMTVTTSKSSLPFPAISTPRVSTFKTDGRRRSFIGVGVPPTPTTASSRVEVRGWIGS